MTDNEFFDWINESIGFGMERLAAGSSLPAVNFRTRAGVRRIVELPCDSESFDDDLDAGRQVIAADQEARFYALVWEGIAAEDDGQEFDAIYVEVGERAGNAILMAQVYEQTDEELSLAGDLLFIENRPNLWELSASKGRTGKTNGGAKSPVAIDSIDALAFYASSCHLEQVNDGVEALCVFIIDNADEMHNVVIQANPGEASADLLAGAPDFLQQFENGKLYAVTTVEVIDLNGKDFETVVIRTGDREGNAQQYIRKFERKPSGKVARAAKPQIHSTAQNMWESTGDHSR
jgi:hypothetical protein